MKKLKVDKTNLKYGARMLAAASVLVGVPLGVGQWIDSQPTVNYIPGQVEYDFPTPTFTTVPAVVIAEAEEAVEREVDEETGIPTGLLVEERSPFILDSVLEDDGE